MAEQQSIGSIVRRDLIPVDEFREEGYLQEANRTFFHPLGLALSIRGGLTEEHVRRLLVDAGYEVEVAEEVGACMTLVRALGLDQSHVVGVHDGRDDPEGVVFQPSLDHPEDRDRALRVECLWEEAAKVRREALGFVVQPVGGVLTTTERIKDSLIDLGGDFGFVGREALSASIAADLGQ